MASACFDQVCTAAEQTTPASYAASQQPGVRATPAGSEGTMGEGSIFHSTQPGRDGP